jgi:cytochrome c oxidase subunit 2
MSAPHSGRHVQPKSHFGLRLTIFIAVVVLVAGTAVLLVRPRTVPTAADQTVEVTMAGFQPARLAVSAGKPTTIRLVNPDSPYHTDGGGLHQFAAPELGLDVKVQPKSEQVFTIAAAKPGTYAFYCDVCCGGKANPSMQGTIVVT